jgi:hypothetical protein
MYKLLPIAVALFLAVAPMAFPQAAAINGQIEGTVTDATGAVGPGATVGIANTGTGFKREVRTDDSGFFRFTVLPLGIYELTVQATGFNPEKRSGIVLTAGATATIDLAMRVGGTINVVEVTSSAPVVEPGRTDLGATLSTNQIENLPLVSRNPYNFILIQPNVSAHPNTEFGVPRKINANGFVDRINYQLDGSNNTQSDRAGIRLLPISDTFLAEVQQVNNGFAPEFGNTIGTVFNAITKSGTNSIHGEGGYLFRRTDFSAKPTLLTAGAPKPPNSVDAEFADVGGRIIKDKLFWFGAFEHVKRDLPAPVTVSAANIAAIGLPASFGNAIPFGQNVYFFMGKGDWQINQSNRLTFRYNYFRNESPFNNGNTAGITVQTQTYLFKDRAPVYGAQLISIISPNAVNEFRFQVPKRFQRQTAFDATGGQPAITISGLINFGGSEQTGLVFTEKTPEWADNFSFTHRTHTFKVGGDFRYILDNQTAAVFARYTFASVADFQAAQNGTNLKSYSNFTQTLGNPVVKYNSLFSGIYVQDDWKVRPNLTFTYGVRYDVYRVPSANKSSLFPASQNFATDKNNFAPRLGIAWALGHDQKTVIRANYGIFYDAPQTNVYYRALLNNGQPQFFNLSTAPSGAFAPAFPTIFSSLPSGFNLALQDITTVSPNFRSLYSSNANFQISRELTPNLSASISYLYTKGTHIPVYRNINVVPAGGSLADGRPLLKSGGVFPQFNNVISAESVGNSEYSGLNFTLNRRFGKGIEFFGTYTYLHGIDDAPEQNVLDTNANWVEDPTNRRRDRGNSLGDRRHAFIGSGVFHPRFEHLTGPAGYLVNNNQLSMFLTAQNGDIFDLVGNKSLIGDPTIPASQQRPLFIGRNTVRGPNIYELNLRYSRMFPIGERFRPEFLAEATNVFNHANITGINTTATVDATGAITKAPSYLPTASLDQRLVQLGIKVSF